ncbi:hypothetical protein E2C01_055488 [Portunus trituberculatus]|uniref:Uncharacterized protein n=1 Tax=Portunus trituberculatus TaxID=210409 RepID=A0A5B7GUX4_PORTR|nr:hypothetical protein [Portunus trituberculatus]
MSNPSGKRYQMKGGGPVPGAAATPVPISPSQPVRTPAHLPPLPPGTSFSSLFSRLQLSHVSPSLVPSHLRFLMQHTLYLPSHAVILQRALLPLFAVFANFL